MRTRPLPGAALAACAALLLAASAAAQSTPLLERREVRVDGHPISVWSKRPPTPARDAVLLVHGRTWSSRPNFDLRVPGLQMSLMDALVRRGYAVYAVDLRGYGGTPRDSTGWNTPDRAALDVSAVLDWVSSRESRPLRPRRATLLGYSNGALVSALVAQRHPEKLGGLVLYGFPAQVVGQTAPPPDLSAPERRRTTAEAAGEDFISPQATLPGVKEAYVAMATTTDPVRTDWRQMGQFLALDPKQLRVPTLLLQGERDPYANAGDPAGFFAKLGTPDRWWVVLPGVDHAAHLETQEAFVDALASFLERRRGAKGR